MTRKSKCGKSDRFWLQHMLEKYRYDCESGLLINSQGKSVGSKTRNGYLRIKARLDGSRYEFYVHRVIFLMQEGRWPDLVDHIDGDRKNNSWANLREVDSAENTRNSPLYRSHKRGVFGVRKRRNKYQASIGARPEWIGTFDDFFEAVCARKSAEISFGFHRNHGRPEPQGVA